MSYSLEILQSFTDEEINQIILYFKGQLLTPHVNRLNAIILSFNNNLLALEDRPYVMHPEFNKLYNATDTQLRIMAQERGFTTASSNKVTMIKYIIDNINEPIIPVVNNLTSTTKKLVLYNMNNNLYLCGTGTFNLREQLKALGGIWNPNSKCWSFPLSARSNLLNLTSSTTTELAPTTNIVTVEIPPEIPNINRIPSKIPNNLQIYQNNDRVLLCGSRTYGLQDQLKAYNGQFDSNVKCWSFPPDQANNVLELYNSTIRNDYLEAERTLTRQQNQERTKIQQQSRLQIYEPETNFIPRVNRLTSEEVANAELNGNLEELEDRLERADINELRSLWENKIQILNYIPGGLSKEAILTYTGDIKPPNLAFEYKLNNWQRFYLGASVRRIDYKKYNVTIFGTD